MEFNPQNTEKLADNSDSSGQLLARSYKCSFCKKGFSNAQALGGHMNIHRRDRAKLKQLSEEEEDDDEKFLSLDISVKNPIHKPSNSQEKVLFHLDSVEDENYTNSLHNKKEEKEKKIEIDLELRLGVDHEATTFSTREFF